ncbi:hypothetical protein MTO96_049550 [Rhipicephalus appendiculatus]
MPEACTMRTDLLTFVFLMFAFAALTDMAGAYEVTHFDIGLGCPKSLLTCSQECRRTYGHRGGYCNGPFNIVCTCT